MMHRLFLVLWFFCGTAFAAPQADNEALGQKAVEAERRGDFAGAISAFQQLIKNGGDSPELRDNLGIAYYQVHDFSAALHQFRIALAANSGSEPGNLFAGLSLLKMQRPKAALAYLERAHTLQPEAAAPLLAAAQAEIALNQVRSARANYEQATRLEPENAEAWYGLSISDRVLAEQEVKSRKPETSRAFMDASEQAMQRAMKLNPDSVRARMLLGESFRIAEQYEDSLREYRAATAEQPRLAAAWSGLAASYSASGDDENAQKAAARAHELDPEDPDTNALIAAIYLRQGNTANAESFAVHALRIEPDLSGAHVVLAKIYLAKKQPQQALPELQAAVKDDNDGSTYYLLATTLRELGRREEAASAMQKYKQLHSVHVAPISSNR
jgi:tetratricopeptide (TPR) repeat protein